MSGPDKPDRNGASGRGEDEASRVGAPNNRPEGTRWQKGCPSPNPHGRPRKRELNTFLPGKIFAWAAEFLDFDRSATGVQDASGEDITFGKAFLRSLHKRALTDNRAAALYEDMRKAAHEEETKLRLKLIEEMNYHRARYQPQFEQAEAMGQPLPKVYPDPRDIVLEGDGTVRFDGPTTHDEAKRLEYVLAMRDAALQAINSIVIDDPARRDELITVRDYLRRRIYRYNQFLPKHLCTRIPALKEVSGSEPGSDEP